MKKAMMLLMVPFYFLLVAGFTCNDPNASSGEPGKACFWKKRETAETHYLYVDNVQKGILPFLPAQESKPGSEIVQQQGLSVILKPGNYDILVKDSSGNIFCKGILFLKRTAGQKEISASWENDQCMVQVLYADDLVNTPTERD